MDRATLALSFRPPIKHLDTPIALAIGDLFTSQRGEHDWKVL